MIRFDRDDLNKILGEFLGKPWQKMARGPDAYDCYGLVQAFAARLGLDLPEIGAVDPLGSGEAYKDQQANYSQLEWARPWSLVTFCHDLEAHVGIVLPHDNLFLHCPRRGAGRVMAEPLSRRPWRDSIDGYWWPKGYVETVVILSPINNARRAWQFVRAGRTLAEIIEQDIVEGRDIPVQAFLDGQEIPQDVWGDTVPVESQQLAIRPIAEGGKQAAMVAGMLALAVIAPYAAGALSGVSVGAGGALVTSTGAAATASQVFMYQALTAGVMMAGGVALSALVGADEAKQDDSQIYTLNPTTTQRVGSMVPLVYGTYGVKGNVICSYLSGTTILDSESNWSVDRTFNPTTGKYETTYHYAGQVEFIHYATSTLYTKIAYSDGPIGGIVSGTELLNGRDPSYYDGDTDFAVEHFTGTGNQAASSVPDGFELPVNLRVEHNENPVTKTFTAVRCDAISIVLRFDNSFTRLHSDGSHYRYPVGLTIEICQYGDASWHTLASETIYGDCYTSGVRLRYDCSQTYTGGSPYTVTPGNTYVVRVTRTSEARRGNELFYFDSILCSYTEKQRLPGLAYTAISAAASEDLSGALDYYAVIQGKLVRVYDSVTETWSIAWSDNPAWVAFDLLTRPVLSGDGDATPYAVEYYRRLDPSYLILDDFVAFAEWCDALVPDGEGGTEKRYRFNGVFDQDGSAWQQAIRVCKMACAMPYFQGHNIGIVIDKPGTPTQMFNVSNLRNGFSETWVDTSEVATVADVDFNDETSEYGPETYPVPLAGSSEDIPISLDGFGHTKRSQAHRWAGRQLRVNKYMKRTVEIPACLDAVWTKLGDIAYVQHPSLNRATGGRIVEVYADGIKLDKPVDVGCYDTGVALAGAQHTTADYGLRMFAKTPVRLGECTVNALAAGTLTVKVHKYVHGSGITGTAVAVRTFTVTAGVNTIDLNICLPANDAGQEYLLYRSGTFSLLRTATAISWTGLDFANLTLIGGGTASGLVTVAQYYYFFNLHVSNPYTEYALLVRAHDGTAERLTLYDVASVEGDDSDIVTISGTWEYTPNPNDIWTFGEETKVVDLYRVKGFERTGDGHVLIQAAQYTTDYYTEDEEPPKIEAQTYTTNKGGFSPAMLPTTAAALSAALGDVTQNMDTIALSGIVFTGDGVSTVTWTCESTDGEGVRYKGQWCPIQDNATGTTDRYIYFDPNITEPYNLQHTNNLADLVGQERYVLCENVGGVAYRKAGILMTVEEEKLDGIEDGATNGATWDSNISGQPTSLRQTFYQATAPMSGMSTDDLWVDAQSNKLHRYNGTVWVEIQDADIAQALADAATAQATADGKIVTFVQPDPPTTGSFGDIWFESDNGYEMYRWDGSAWVSVRDTGIAQAIADAAGAQATADGKVTTFVQAGPPTAEGVGDLWADTDDGNKLYRWSGTEWVTIQDGSIAAAISAAAGAQATADGKVVTFVQASMPTAEGLGDLWVDSDEGNKLYRWSGTEWVSIQDTGIATALSTAENAQATADGKIVTFIQASVPTAEGLGDLWMDSDDGNKLYRWSGAAWVSVRDTGIATALSTAENAQATADGKIVTFVQASSPTAEGLGDLWIDSDDNNKPYRWSGTAWVAIDYDVATWSKIVGDGKPDDNADVTADNPISTFRETFWDPNGDYLTRWTVTGTGETSLVSGGVAGGKYLHCGDNSGDDRVSILYFRKIDFDPDKLYRMKVRVRRTAGDQALWCGIVGYDSGGNQLVPSGTSAHWICAKSVGPAAEWTTYVCYFKGHSVAGSVVMSPSASSPAALIEGVTQFSVRAFLNYGGGAGIMDLDEIAIDILPSGADEVPESDTRKWAGESGADVTANNAVSIIHHSETEPESPQEGWIWYDSSANPTLVKRHNGTEWVVLGVDLQAWCHAVDRTKLDGSNLYPSTVTTDALAANSVTATQILVEKLSAISAVLGDVIAGSLTGTTITGGVLRTATANRRVQIDSDGIKFLMPGGSGLCGTTANGGSNIVCGTTGSGGTGYVVGAGVLAHFYNMSNGIPFDIVSEQASVGDMHLFPRSNDPTTGNPGDVALVNNKLRVCTSATPTWQDL